MTKKEATLIVLALVSRGVKVHLTEEGIAYLQEQNKEVVK